MKVEYRNHTDHKLIKTEQNVPAEDVPNRGDVVELNGQSYKVLNTLKDDERNSVTCLVELVVGG